MLGRSSSVVSRLLLAVAILGTIGCDRVTKQWARESLVPGDTHSYAGDTIRMQYSENSGAFLSLGASWPEGARLTVFTVGAGALLVGAAIYATLASWPPIMLWGLGLVAAGGASNIVDRATSGVVVDFLNIGIGQFRTGIFNVADMAIMAGAAILVMSRRGHKAG